MTAVLEPQAPERSTFSRNRGECPEAPAVSVVVANAGLHDSTLPHDAPAAPLHCGAAMRSTPVPVPSLGWASTELDSHEWTCACGFKMDVGITADSMEAVRLESAMLESLQWEMDATQERFENAVRTAFRLGAAPDALGKAAGLTAAELQEILADGVPLL